MSSTPKAATLGKDKIQDFFQAYDIFLMLFLMVNSVFKIKIVFRPTVPHKSREREEREKKRDIKAM